MSSSITFDLVTAIGVGVNVFMAFDPWGTSQSIVALNLASAAFIATLGLMAE